MSRRYQEKADAIVARLRSLADEVERAAVPAPGPSVTGTGRYVTAAIQVQHAVTWGVANLTAYHLVDDAVTADAAEADG